MKQINGFCFYVRDSNAEIGSSRDYKIKPISTGFNCFQRKTEEKKK